MLHPLCQPYSYSHLEHECQDVGVYVSQLQGPLALRALLHLGHIACSCLGLQQLRQPGALCTQQQPAGTMQETASHTLLGQDPVNLLVLPQ